MSSHPAPCEAPAAQPTLAAARPLIWLIGLSHGTNHLVMLIFPAVLLLVQAEFGLGYGALGVVANAGLLLYGLGALPAGILADRLGGERILAIWLLGGGLSCLVIAAANGALSLALGLAALGLFASLHHPAGSGLLVALRSVPALDVSRAFGLVGVLGNWGLGASPLVAAAVGAAWGWRQAFALGALPALALGVCLWRRPRLAPPAGARKGAWGIPWRELRLPLILLFSLETLMGFVFQGFTTFLPAHLAEHGGIPGFSAAAVTRGGVLASLAYLVGGFGHALAGRLMGLRRRQTIFLAAVAIASLCLVAMGTTTGMALVASSILVTFAHFGLATMSNSLIATQAPPHLGGTAFGITFVLAFGVGSLASSTMGALAEYAGLHAVFLALAGVSFAATTLVALFGMATRVAAQP
jgi:MFS family permease